MALQPVQQNFPGATASAASKPAAPAPAQARFLMPCSALDYVHFNEDRCINITVSRPVRLSSVPASTASLSNILLPLHNLATLAYVLRQQSKD